jgi:hypothetical protein
VYLKYNNYVNNKLVINETIMKCETMEENIFTLESSLHSNYYL